MLFRSRWHSRRAWDCFLEFIRRCALRSWIRLKRCGRRTEMIPVRQDFRENLGLAFDTIRTHKLRSFLAVLGVLIGVALIILVVGLVQGFRTSISEESASDSVDTAWEAHFTQGPGLNGRRLKEEREHKPLTCADAPAVMTQSPAVNHTEISVFEWTQ